MTEKENNLNPSQFGMSQRELNEMQGRALGEHLYEGMEKILTGEKGGFKAANHARALEKMRDYPAKHVTEDADGDPMAHITTGNWTSTWHGGGMIEHSHKVHGPQDVTNITDYSNPEHGMFGPGPTMSFKEFKAHHDDFLNYVKTEYPKYMQ